MPWIEPWKGVLNIALKSALNIALNRALKSALNIALKSALNTALKSTLNIALKSALWTPPPLDPHYLLELTTPRSLPPTTACHPRPHHTYTPPTHLLMPWPLPSSGSRIWSGGAKHFFRDFADVAKRSQASEASRHCPGSRACLRALEALAFLTLKYSFSHFSWNIFFKIFNVHLCGYSTKYLFQHERFWSSS